MPGVTPVLSACDFEVPLPSRFAGETEDNGGGVTLHRVDYHIFMARVAVVYHDFRESLATYSPADAVRQGDEKLAEIILTLPDHLQPDGLLGGAEKHALENEHPWLRWQRVNIALVLLSHRLHVNRFMLQHCQRASETAVSARAIATQTAEHILWISQNWEVPVAAKRQWCA